MKLQDLIRAYVEMMRSGSQQGPAAVGRLLRGEKKAPPSKAEPTPPPVTARVSRGVSKLLPPELKPQEEEKPFMGPLEEGGPTLEELLVGPDVQSRSVPTLATAPPSQNSPTAGGDSATPIELAHAAERDEQTTPQAFANLTQDPLKTNRNWTLGIGAGLGLVDILRSMQQEEGKVGSSLAGYMGSIEGQQKTAIEQRLAVERDLREQDFESSKMRRQQEAEETSATRAHKFREEEAESQWNRGASGRATNEALSKIQMIGLVQQIQQRNDISPAQKAQLLSNILPTLINQGSDPMLQHFQPERASQYAQQGQATFSELGKLLGIQGGADAPPPPPSPTSSIEESALKVAAQRIMKSNGGKAPSTIEMREALKQLAAESGKNPDVQRRLLQLAAQMVQEGIPRQ